MRRAIATTRRACLGVLIALALDACAAHRPQGVSVGERERAPGIEVQWWVAEARPDAGESLGKVIAGYESALVPGDPSATASCRANGLRLFTIPRREVESLRARLRAVGPTQEQWLGQVPQWTAIVKGPRSEAPMRLEMDNGLLTLPAGSIRLLARAWIEPMEPSPGDDGVVRAGVRVELVPQHEEASPRRAGLEASLAVKHPGGAAEAGLLFSRLEWRATLAGDRALVIVPERPGESWEPPPEDGAPLAGPAPARFPTLGEAMLAGEHGSRRVVVVIVPTAPERYELLR